MTMSVTEIAVNVYSAIICHVILTNILTFYEVGGIQILHMKK